MIDYQEFCPIDTPSKDRKRFNVGNIFSNSIQCLKCNDIIRSKNRHDYVTCKCGACSIDGGSWYMKVSGDFEQIKDLSVMYNDVAN